MCSTYYDTTQGLKFSFQKVAANLADRFNVPASATSRQTALRQRHALVYPSSLLLSLAVRSFVSEQEEKPPSKCSHAALLPLNVWREQSCEKFTTPAGPIAQA